MKTFSNILALLITIGILVALGYGIYKGYEFLRGQTFSIHEPWQIVLVTMAAVGILSVVILASAIRYHADRPGSAFTAEKSRSYLYFIRNWHKPDDVELDSLLTIYAGQKVLTEYLKLRKFKQTLPQESNKVMEQAGRVILEMRKDLGGKNDLFWTKTDFASFHKTPITSNEEVRL